MATGKKGSEKLHLTDAVFTAHGSGFYGTTRKRPNSTPFRLAFFTSSFLLHLTSLIVAYISCYLVCRGPTSKRSEVPVWNTVGQSTHTHTHTLNTTLHYSTH